MKVTRTQTLGNSFPSQSEPALWGLCPARPGLQEAWLPT